MNFAENPIVFSENHLFIIYYYYRLQDCNKMLIFALLS